MACVYRRSYQTTAWYIIWCSLCSSHAKHVIANSNTAVITKQFKWNYIVRICACFTYISFHRNRACVKASTSQTCVEEVITYDDMEYLLHVILYITRDVLINSHTWRKTVALHGEKTSIITQRVGNTLALQTCNKNAEMYAFHDLQLTQLCHAVNTRPLLIGVPRGCLI